MGLPKINSAASSDLFNETQGRKERMANGNEGVDWETFHQTREKLEGRLNDNDRRTAILETEMKDLLEVQGQRHQENINKMDGVNDRVRKLEWKMIGAIVAGVLAAIDIILRIQGH